MTTDPDLKGMCLQVCIWCHSTFMSPNLSCGRLHPWGACASVQQQDWPPGSWIQRDRWDQMTQWLFRNIKTTAGLSVGNSQGAKHSCARAHSLHLFVASNSNIWESHVLSPVIRAPIFSVYSLLISQKAVIGFRVCVQKVCMIQKLTSIYHLLCRDVVKRGHSFWGEVFRINKLEFQPEFLGCVKLVVVVATLAGVAVYNCCLKDVPLKKMFFWTTIFRTLLGLMQVKFHFWNHSRNDCWQLHYLCTFLGALQHSIMSATALVSSAPIRNAAWSCCWEGRENTSWVWHKLRFLLFFFFLYSWPA